MWRKKPSSWDMEGKGRRRSMHIHKDTKRRACPLVVVSPQQQSRRSVVQTGWAVVEAKIAVWIVPSLLTLIISEAPRRLDLKRESSDPDF